MIGHGKIGKRFVLGREVVAEDKVLNYGKVDIEIPIGRTGVDNITILIQVGVKNKKENMSKIEKNKIFSQGTFFMPKDQGGENILILSFLIIRIAATVSMTR